jgi:hypothetical protein
MKASWGKVRVGAIAILGVVGLAILAIVVLNSPGLVQAQLSQPVQHPHPSEQAAGGFRAPAISGTWTPLINQPSFGPPKIATSLMAPGGH